MKNAIKIIVCLVAFLGLTAFSGGGNGGSGGGASSTIYPNTAPSAGQVPVGNAGGTAYVPQTLSGAITINSSGVTALVAGALNPYTGAVDITGNQGNGSDFINQVCVNKVCPVTAFGASGVSVGYTYTISAASAQPTLTTSLGLIAGNGVKLEHAGATCSINSSTCVQPSAPSSVTHQGNTGAVPYCYEIANLDAGGGITQASASTCYNTGVATNLIGPTDDGHSNYLSIAWAAVTGASGYALYRQTGGSGNFVLIWVGNTTSYNDGVVGLLTVALTATQAPDVPLVAPSATLNDYLLTSCSSGCNTTTPTLAAAATNAVTINNGTAYPDDSAAINAAALAIPANYKLSFPRGSYNYTGEGISIVANNVKLIGDGEYTSTINQFAYAPIFGTCTGPTDPCGLISVFSNNVEISDLGLVGLEPFGAYTTSHGKGIYGHVVSGAGALYVHDVYATRVSGETIYADGSNLTSVRFVHNTLFSDPKVGLNTNTTSIPYVLFSENNLRDVAEPFEAVGFYCMTTSNTIACDNGTGVLTSPYIGCGFGSLSICNTDDVENNILTNLNATNGANPLLQVGQASASGQNDQGAIVGNIITNSKIACEGGACGALLVDNNSGAITISDNTIAVNGRNLGGPNAGIVFKDAIAGPVTVQSNTLSGASTNQDTGITINTNVGTSNGILIGPNNIIEPTPYKFPTKIPQYGVHDANTCSANVTMTVGSGTFINICLGASNTCTAVDLTGVGTCLQGAYTPTSGGTPGTLALTGTASTCRVMCL